jgi:protein-L-isoaspartate(D-aspartate) O-methyltransferase
MTEALVQSGPMEKVLEIGAGCGYQTAVLAHFAKWVYSVERIGVLARRLRERLRTLGYANVRVRHGDGRLGWPHYAPYDAILIAAAVLSVPDQLLDQLRIGGRLIAPVGEPGWQQLRLVTRRSEGFEELALDEVRFVPLVDGLG